MPNNENRDILVITADAVKFNGEISFKFKYEADRERKLWPMPKQFGYVWKTDMAGESYSFNVFEGGKGLVAGGGWTKEDGFAWEQEIFEAIPSRTLLMDIDLLPWWKELTEKHGVKFRHHHHAGILTTA